MRPLSIEPRAVASRRERLSNWLALLALLAVSIMGR